MPPEFLRGMITPMYDIFSLGVIILEVITGHRDYPDDIRKSSDEFIKHVSQFCLTFSPQKRLFKFSRRRLLF